MTKRILHTLVFAFLLPFTNRIKAESISNDSLVLNLQSLIQIAQSQSPSAQSARNTFLAAYWNYRYFRANYLPSVTLSSSPYINKEVNKITQSDGTAMFIGQNQFGADLSLTINQNIALTGGNVFVKSGLNRLDEFQNKSTSYSASPISFGYQQSLLGYNSLKWDKRIEPIRYREAKKQYAEALELVSATACNYFFRLATAQMVLDMARQNYASADTLYRMAKGRYSIGTITENEMLQLEINRLNEESNVMDAQIAFQEQLQSVRSFLGLEQSTDIQLIIPDSVPQFSVPLDKAINFALENSPDPDYYKRIVTESKSTLANARANSGLKAELYLQFGLSQTGKELSSAYRNLMNQEYASISLVLPILDWGRSKGRVRVAKSQLALTESQAEQGMNDFYQNIEKLVMQFNMQAHKVKIARLTDKRANQRHMVARQLYIMGRNSILDLNSSINEKNVARRGHLSAMQTYWSLYYTIRSMTAYDFEKNLPISEELPIE